MSTSQKRSRVSHRRIKEDIPHHQSGEPFVENIMRLGCNGYRILISYPLLLFPIKSIDRAMFTVDQYVIAIKSVIQAFLNCAVRCDLFQPITARGVFPTKWLIKPMRSRLGFHAPIDKSGGREAQYEL